MAACGAPPSGAKPASPRPFDDNMHRTTRVFTPGRRTFSLSAHPGCAPRLPGVSIERTYDVIGSRPTSGMHRTGADATRQVDVLVAPAVPKEWQAVHVFAIFEDRTGEPFGWRVSFGDGRRPIFGGPSCKPSGTRPDGRYERHFQRDFSHPAEYRLRIELSRSCLRTVDRNGRVVVDEIVYVRPRAQLPRGFAYLPAHRYPPIRRTELPPVRLAGDGRTDCFWLERVSDGERLQVLWPDGTSRLLKPMQVFSDSSWKVGKVRKDVSAIGVGSVDALPERCRFDDEALLLAPLPEPPPPRGR
jgi:hypothetical protein